MDAHRLPQAPPVRSDLARGRRWHRIHDAAQRERNAAECPRVTAIQRRQERLQVLCLRLPRRLARQLCADPAPRSRGAPVPYTAHDHTVSGLHFHDSQGDTRRRRCEFLRTHR